MPRKNFMASASTGSELFILDITAPAFYLPAAEALATMEAQYLDEAGRQTELPEPVLKALQSSHLGSALLASAGSYLAGMPTYLLKLGPERLGADSSLIDRRIAASFPALCARQRLADVAQLTADGILRVAETHPNRPICVVNIGGGTAADSWNSLILAQRYSRELLKGRPVTVAVLDSDSEGPAFAIRAFRRLSEADAPLHGLDIEVQHWPIAWSQCGQLSEALARLNAKDRICAVSSEGALFEYGSDEEITSVLEALASATPEDTFFVGSVTRLGPCAEAAQRASRAATRPRLIEAFIELAGAAGWQLDECVTRPFSYQVRLSRAAL